MTIYNYFKNMIEGNISQEFRLKNIDEKGNYLIEEINRNELMSRKCNTIDKIIFNMDILNIN